MATITITRNTAVYTPKPKATTKTSKAVRKPGRKAPDKPQSKPETKTENRTANPKPEPKTVPDYVNLWGFDADKIQAEIMKDVKKRDQKIGKGNFEWLWGTTDDCILVSDSHMMFYIPKPNFYLNIETAFRNRTDVLTSLAKADCYSGGGKYIAEYTGEKRQLDNTKATVDVLRISEIGEEIWVNEKYLKYFDREKVYFEADSKKSPLYIKSDGGRLLGFILPINHN